LGGIWGTKTSITTGGINFYRTGIKPSKGTKHTHNNTQKKKKPKKKNKKKRKKKHKKEQPPKKKKNNPQTKKIRQDSSRKKNCTRKRKGFHRSQRAPLEEVTLGTKPKRGGAGQKQCV